MKYTNPRSKGKALLSSHLRCKRAADSIAEEKNHILMLEEHENGDVFLAQVRLYLCQCYGFSANGSAEAIAEHLSISKSHLQKPSGLSYNVCIVDEVEI